MSDKAFNKALRNLLIALAILTLAGAVGIGWLFAPDPPDPQSGPQMDDLAFFPDLGPTTIVVTPYSSLETMIIDWPGALYITGALTPTIVMKGPVTVRFFE